MLRNVHGRRLLLCDNCYDLIQKDMQKSAKVVPENSSLSSSSLSDPLARRSSLVVVTFVSPPLGISLHCGEGQHNARLVKMERYDNNDNGVRVPLNSYVLQVNSVVVVGMGYATILSVIKQASYPLLITFGPLYDSVKKNLMNLICSPSGYLSRIALVPEKKSQCNFTLCPKLLVPASSVRCDVCERCYCKNHCKRLLFLSDDRVSRVCAYCFPCVFHPFDSMFSGAGARPV